MNNGIFLGLGTNEGDRLHNLMLAKESILKTIGRIVQESSVYKTAPWGNVEQPDFYNQVIEIETSLSPEDLLKQTLLIEHDLGRVRTMKWGPRVMDIDVLIYQHHIVTSAELTIPHPGIQHRKFVLYPFAEIAQDVMHPTLQKTIGELLQVCDDDLAVEKVVIA